MTEPKAVVLFKLNELVEKWCDKTLKGEERKLWEIRKEYVFNVCALVRDSYTNFSAFSFVINSEWLGLSLSPSVYSGV